MAVVASDLDFSYRVDVARGCGADVAPLLIERKSAVDVAASLRDGRWTRQHAAV